DEAERPAPVRNSTHVGTEERRGPVFLLGVPRHAPTCEIALMNAALFPLFEITPESGNCLTDDRLRIVRVDQAKRRIRYRVSVRRSFDDLLLQVTRAWQDRSQKLRWDADLIRLLPRENEKIVRSRRQSSLDDKEIRERYFAGIHSRSRACSGSGKRRPLADRFQLVERDTLRCLWLRHRPSQCENCQVPQGRRRFLEHDDG